MMKIKTVDDIWKEFKVRHYGKQIQNISRTQIVESEMIFKMAIACCLVHLREEVSLLPDDVAVSVMENHMKEIMKYLEVRSAEYKKENGL